MKIKYYSPETLSSEQIRTGLEFIQRRYFEEWSVNRIDINVDKIKNRANILLYDRKNLIGWLGIESDGEITNCCIDEKYNGIYHLQMLIKEAYKSFPQKHFYAHVPTKQFGSACAFIKTGMKPSEPPETNVKEYQEKSIKLVRLDSVDTRKDFNIKDEHLADMLDRIKALEKEKVSTSVSTKIKNYIKSNYKTYMLCLIMTFALYFILIKNVAKISWQDYFSYVFNNVSYKEDQEIFKDHFDFLTNKIESYEKLSYKHQINLIKKILSDEERYAQIIYNDEFSKILNITNKNQDIIRIVRNIRKFHSDLINKGIYNKKTLNIINALCEAYRLVLSDTGDALVPHIKKNLQIGKEQFEIVLKAAEKLPNDLRDDIKLESLRYLTYCSLRLEEENTKIEEKWVPTADKLEKEKRGLKLEKEMGFIIDILSDSLERITKERKEYYTIRKNKLDEIRDILYSESIKRDNYIENYESFVNQVNKTEMAKMVLQEQDYEDYKLKKLNGINKLDDVADHRFILLREICDVNENLDELENLIKGCYEGMEKLNDLANEKPKIKECWGIIEEHRNNLRSEENRILSNAVDKYKRFFRMNTTMKEAINKIVHDIRNVEKNDDTKYYSCEIIKKYLEETSLRYHQDYFWISLVKFIIDIKNGGRLAENVSADYCKYFLCLSTGDSNCVYLKAKLLQHSKLIPSEKREKVFPFYHAREKNNN